MPETRSLRSDLRRPRARLALTLLGSAVLVVALTGLAGAVLASGEVPRGTQVGGVDVGGLSRVEAAARLRAAVPTTLAVRAAESTAEVELAAAGVVLDTDATLDQVEDPRFGPWGRLATLLGTRSVQPVVTVDEGALAAALEPLRAEVDRPMVDGAVGYDDSGVVETVPVQGRVLDLPGVPAVLTDRLLAERAEVVLPVTTEDPTVDAETVAEVAQGPATEAATTAVLLEVDGSEQARTATLPGAAVAAALSWQPDGEGGLAPMLDPELLHAAGRSELAAVEDPAVDATFRIVGGAPQVVPSAPGREVAPADLAEAVLGTLDDDGERRATVALTTAEPRVTTETAQGLGIVEPIGSFTTRHACCAPRVQNIHAIADLLQGYVVLPGETFSLNEVVGERDTARGFVPAPMINRGRFVDSVGGGISQFATTMFNAVFFAGLEDVQHKPHSYYISRYPAGRESTVSFPEPDFRWRNDSPHGVLVVTSYTERSITVELWGTDRFTVRAEDGPRTRVTPFETQYDPAEECIPMPGEEGFDIEVTRVFVGAGEGGADRREVFRTRYLPEPKVFCQPAPAPPAPAPSPAPPPASPPAEPTPAPAPAPAPSPSPTA